MTAVRLARIERCWVNQDGVWRAEARLLGKTFIDLTLPGELSPGSQVRVISTETGWRLAEGG